MWDGNYSFFDYKYNIEGYSGQDYSGIMRWVYLWGSVITIILLLVLLRKISHRKIDIYLKVIAVLLPALEVTKITWESYWDITTGRGFNFCGLLPLYTCSLFMYCCIGGAFGKGKARENCLSWISTIGFVGGMSNILFIQGLKWYPFFTFGAFHSMFFHFVMVFTSLFVVVTGYKETEWKNIFSAFVPQLIMSAVVITVDYYFGWDYMQYYSAGGVPFVEGISSALTNMGMRWLTAVIMLFLYFALTVFLVSVYKLIGNINTKHNKKEASVL